MLCPWHMGPVSRSAKSWKPVWAHQGAEHARGQCGLVGQIAVAHASEEGAFRVRRLENEDAPWPKRTVGQVEEPQQFVFAEMLDKVHGGDQIERPDMAGEILERVAVFGRQAPALSKFDLLRADVHTGQIHIPAVAQKRQKPPRAAAYIEDGRGGVGGQPMTQVGAVDRRSGGACPVVATRAGKGGISPVQKAAVSPMVIAGGCRFWNRHRLPARGVGRWQSARSLRWRQVACSSERQRKTTQEIAEKRTRCSPYVRQ